MEVINDALNNRTKIIIEDKEINIEEIEKVEKKPFSLSRDFKTVVKLKSGESLSENYSTLQSLHENFEKLINKAGFNNRGFLREDRVKYKNGKIYFKDTIINSKEIAGIRKVRKSQNSRFIFRYYSAKLNEVRIEVFISGGGVIAFDTMEEYAEYDFNQLKKILESN